MTTTIRARAPLAAAALAGPVLTAADVWLLIHNNPLVLPGVVALAALTLASLVGAFAFPAGHPARRPLRVASISLILTLACGFFWLRAHISGSATGGPECIGITKAQPTIHELPQSSCR